MTPEEQEYFNRVSSKFNELKDIMENPPASLCPKDSNSLSNAMGQIKQAEDKLTSLKAGALIGAGTGALTGAVCGACFGPFGALAGAIIGAISGGLIGATVGYYLLDVISTLAKAKMAWNRAFGIAN